MTLALDIQIHFVLPVLTKSMDLENAPLLVTQQGNRLSGRDITKGVTQLFAFAFGKLLTPQNLRRSMTTHISELQMKIDSTAYQNLMAHSTRVGHEVIVLLMRDTQLLVTDFGVAVVQPKRQNWRNRGVAANISKSILSFASTVPQS